MAQKDQLLAPYKLKLLITICDREKRNFYIDVLEGYEVNMQTVLYGRGTAPSDLYNYLGVSNDKAIIVSVVKENRVKEILINYEDKYFKTKKGKGVAFTVPLSSVIGAHIYKFLANLKGEGDDK